jgi:uncharacterized protein (DUF1015 family)
MVDIRPFAALRPPVAATTAVAAPPYDVMNRAEAKALIGRKPSSFLRVTRSDALLPDSVDPHGDAALAEALTQLQSLKANKLLVRDEAPCLYLYEQVMGDHVQVGVVAGVSAQEYADGVIKRHEKTRTAALEGRRRHIETVALNTGLVFLTYRGTAKLDALVADITDATPTVAFTAEDGIGHRLWVVERGAALDAFVKGFEDVPVLYVADGHHRTHASYQIWQSHRETAPGEPGTRGIDHFMAVLFPHNQLQILAYNRIVQDLGGHTEASLLEAVNASFSTAVTDTPNPPSPGSFGMYLGGSWHRLKPHKHVLDALPATGDPDALDVAVLQRYLLTPCLGIGDPRTDQRIKFVGGIRGSGELEKRVNADGGVAFTVFPTAIEQVMNVADAGGIMPPKSTWFEPKVMSGLVVRELGAFTR